MLGKRGWDILSVFTLGLLSSWVLESLHSTPTASELSKRGTPVGGRDEGLFGGQQAGLSHVSYAGEYELPW